MVRDILAAASGVDEKLDVESVFSTYLYTGNGATQTINNGIDLAGKGGLVWIKGRANALNHCLFDSGRGISNRLITNNTTAQAAYTNGITLFNSNGFALGSDNVIGEVNYASGNTYASWTFRKAPKFFDIVTYTGNGVAGRQIPHNLGCEVGMIVIKRTDTTGPWAVSHRYDFGNVLALNTTSAAVGNTASNGWFGYPVNPLQPTYFTLGTSVDTNAVGGTYVAYLFAHDTSADGIIQCRSFTTDGSGNATVSLGWEPQYVLAKKSSSTGDWAMYDSMRGLGTDSTVGMTLWANSSAAEAGPNDFVSVTSTGLKITGWGASSTYIYMAIRRPMKVPTSGSEVFAIANNDGVTNGFLANFPVDFSMMASKTTSDKWYQSSRLTGSNYLTSNLTNAETSSPAFGGFDSNSRWYSGLLNTSYYAWMFKRAKGFFDIVCYTGTGVARTVNHNLGVVPELMIVKPRSTSGNWLTYNATLGNTGTIILNLSSAADTGNSTIWNSTVPTSSVFSIGVNSTVNTSTVSYVTYLFATLAGISKVGSYTGNGSSQTINCGFTTGARFILIKRTDSTGDWYIWDTARGIVAANDPHLSLNTTAAEVTTDDSIDPAVEGFMVNQNTATNINVNAGTYIFLAIA